MIIKLTKGMFLTSKHPIQYPQVKFWKYAGECCDIGGGIAPGTKLRVEETCTTPGVMWVKASLPGSFPPKCLKISADEYVRNFEIA